MNHTHEQKTGETSGKAAAHRQAKRMDHDASVEDGISYEFAEMANHSAQATQLKTIQTAANRYTQSQSMPIPAVAQPVGENRTGLPDGLKAGIEHLSGFGMDDVKVHYNSSKPATLQAHAYAQGTQIHLGPGQERHLPHEAWHVVQQKQGRVRPTLQMKGVDINDDEGLESEADRMGALALRSSPALPFTPPTPTGNGSGNVQRRVVQRFGEELGWAEAAASFIAIVGIRAAYALFNSAPYGRSKADIVKIAWAVGLRRMTLLGDVQALAQMPWQINNILLLAGHINTNNNGLTVLEWINIATALAVESPGDVAQLARLQGWASADITTLVQNRAGGNAGGHTEAQWATIATYVTARDHAGATALAELNGWNYASINTLAQSLPNNANHFTATEWATIAGRVPANDHAGAIALASIAGWNFGAVDALAQAGTAANFNGHTPVQWAGIAGRLVANSHADAAALAGMLHWTAGNIDTLAQHYRNQNPQTRSLATWLAVAALPTRLRNNANNVRDFMGLPAGWNNLSATALATEFDGNHGNRGIAAWLSLATSHANIHNHEADVAVFARMPSNWQNQHLVTLAGYFAAGANNFTATEWSTIAQASAAVRNRPDDVRDFARIANWNHLSLVALATEYNNNPLNYSALQWRTIALAHVNLRNRPTQVGEFARMDRWAANHATDLATRFGAAQPTNFSAAQWAAIAIAHLNLVNQPANTERFARINNWQFANANGLAQAFGAGNPGGFTAAQWILIAEAGVALRDHEADVAHFARMDTWTAARILTLAQHYCANANGRSAEDWALIANHHNNLLNLPNDARDFALLSNQITRAQLIAIARHLQNRGINMANTRQLIGQLHPAISGANLALLVPAVATVANLVAVRAGAYGGNSFAALATLLINTGRWTAAQVGAAVEEFNTPGNAPTANVFCRLLDVSRNHARLTPASLTVVLQTENPGAAVDWNTACAEFDDFMAAAHAQPGGPFDTNGAVLASAIYNSIGAPNIQVEVQYRQNRLNHFTAGHTFNHFLFTHANTHRAGSPYSFWAPGTNVQAQANVLVNNGLLTEATDSIRNNIFTQRVSAGYESGFMPLGVVHPLIVNQQYTTEITQFYPLGANVLRRISGSILHLVGRLMGFY